MISVPVAQREFAETGIPGVRVCVCWKADHHVAYLTEFKAGARFPDHGHHGSERSMLLAGRLQLGSLDMLPGDFMEIGAGESHAAHALEDSVLYTQSLAADLEG
jgi:hypothetical protein